MVRTNPHKTKSNTQIFRRVSENNKLHPKTMARSRIVTLRLSSENLKRFNPKQMSKTSSSSNSKAEHDQLLTPKKSNAPKPSIKKPSSTPETPLGGTPQPAAVPAKSTFGRAAADDKLDKSGRAVRKWEKKPLKIQSFTGYIIDFKAWTGDSDESYGTVKKNKSDSAEVIKSENANGKTQPPIKIQLKLNNKTLMLNKKSNGTLIDDDLMSDSRDQSPVLDDASSIISTPDVSAVSTPAP